MKRILLGLAVTILLISFNVKSYAQYSTSGIGLGVAIPTGDFKDLVKSGYGAFLEGEIGITEQFTITMNTSLSVFATKFSNLSIMHILVQPGARYYMREQGYGFFVGAKMGVNYGIYRDSSWEEDTFKDWQFGYAPEIGYSFKEVFLLGLKYQGITGGGKIDAIQYLGISATVTF